MKVFLDTNVLVSAAATRGICADVLREVLALHELVVSPPLLKKLKRVLIDKLGLPKDIISDLLSLIQEDAICSKPGKSATVVPIKDKDDVVILSTALNGKADIFVTGDKELLRLRKVGTMEIVSPRGLWEKLKA